MAEIKSLSEIRVGTAKDSSEVSPRDVLEELIRRIDAGEMDVNCLIIIAQLADGEIREMHARVTFEKAYLLGSLLRDSTWDELKKNCND